MIVHLEDNSQEEFDSVAGEFGLHPLAVEDAIKAHQRPKIERYGEMLFVVLRPARYVDEWKPWCSVRRTPTLRRSRRGQEPYGSEHRPKRGNKEDQRLGGDPLRSNARRDNLWYELQPYAGATLGLGLSVRAAAHGDGLGHVVSGFQAPRVALAYF